MYRVKTHWQRKIFFVSKFVKENVICPHQNVLFGVMESIGKKTLLYVLFFQNNLVIIDDLISKNDKVVGY